MKLRAVYVVAFALFGALVFPIVWFIESMILSYDINFEIEEFIERIQVYLIPGWLFQSLLLVRADGYVFPYPVQVIGLVNMTYWAIIGYIVTLPKIASVWFKFAAGLISMIVLTNLMVQIVSG